MIMFLLLNFEIVLSFIIERVLKTGKTKKYASKNH